MTESVRNVHSIDTQSNPFYNWVKINTRLYTFNTALVDLDDQTTGSVGFVAEP